jgi:hypothetical protein
MAMSHHQNAGQEQNTKKSLTNVPVFEYLEISVTNQSWIHEIRAD